MEKVIYNLVFNRKKRLNAEGKALIQVEAYLNRQKKYFSTKIYVKPTQWDSKKRAVRNHPNMDELNRYMEDYISYLERIELDMVQSGRPFSLEYLRERGDFESASSSFVSFMKSEIEHSNLRLSTLKNHMSTLLVLCSISRKCLLKILLLISFVILNVFFLSISITVIRLPSI